MSLFFSLSGFLITTTLLNGLSPKAFFVRRLARILPLAYGYLALVYLLMTFDPGRLLASSIFIQNYVQIYLDNLNGHFWSLCVEVHFYLAIGVAVAIFGRRSIWIVIPACILVTALRVSNGITIDIRTHLRVDEILAGAAVAILYSMRPKLQTSNWSILLAAVVWFLASWPPCGVLQYLRPYCSAALVATALWLRPCFVLTMLSTRLAKYIAEISYALYVFHPLTLHGWMNDGTALQRYLIKRPISFLITVSLAHLSTFHWEQRWTNWAKKVTAQK